MRDMIADGYLQVSEEFFNTDVDLSKRNDTHTTWHSLSDKFTIEFFLNRSLTNLSN